GDERSIGAAEEGFSEIAPFPSVGRIDAEALCAAALAVQLSIERKERSIVAVIDLGNPYRSADDAAKRVAPQRRLRRTGRVEKVVSVEHVIAQKLECGPVKIIAAWPDGGDDVGARLCPILGRVPTRL